MNVPAAGKDFVRVIDLFQAKPIAKFGVAILHLLNGSIAMVSKEETAKQILDDIVRDAVALFYSRISERLDS